MPVSVEKVLTAILTLSAAVMAAALVRREFFPPVGIASVPTRDAEFVVDWKQAVDAGIELGDTTAPIKIVEFGDLECPACRRFAQVVEATTAQRPRAVSLVFVHFPLTIHRFAMPAARAVECAGAQGRFKEFHDLVYDKQDSLGLKAWGAFALHSGVPDTTEFRRCFSKATAVARIDSGLSVGARLGIDATPTVIVNGWRFPRSPNEAELLRVVDELLKGRNPFPKAKGGKA